MKRPSDDVKLNFSFWYAKNNFLESRLPFSMKFSLEYLHYGLILKVPSVPKDTKGLWVPILLAGKAKSFISKQKSHQFQISKDFLEILYFHPSHFPIYSTFSPRPTDCLRNRRTHKKWNFFQSCASLYSLHSYPCIEHWKRRIFHHRKFCGEERKRNPSRRKKKSSFSFIHLCGLYSFRWYWIENPTQNWFSDCLFSNNNFKV